MSRHVENLAREENGHARPALPRPRPPTAIAEDLLHLRGKVALEIAGIEHERSTKEPQGHAGFRLPLHQYTLFSRASPTRESILPASARTTCAPNGVN